MRRVAITGLGAVSPIGARRAVELGRRRLGAERRRVHRVVRRVGVSRADRRRGDGLRHRRARAAEGGAPHGSERPARRRRGAGGVGRRRARGRRPRARRDPRRLGDRRDRDDRQGAAGLRRARLRPRLAVLHPLGARRHGERPDRDPARAARARTSRPSPRARPARPRSARRRPRSAAARRTSCSPAAPSRRSSR